MKKLFFFGACLVALASQPVLAQAVVDVVVVRVAEYVGHTHLTIERSGQAPEEIEFDWSSKAGKGEPASSGYYKALAKLYQQGYQTQAVLPGASYTNGGTTFSTLILARPVGK